MEDTSLNATNYKYQRLAEMTPTERLLKLANLISSTRAMVLAGIKIRYPNCSKDELQKRMAAIILGADFTIKNYNWDPTIEGY